MPDLKEEPGVARPPTAQGDAAAAAVALLQPPERQIVVGICAMTKKSKSKPMTQILERLCKFEYIAVVIMGEDVILNEPVEKWPACDCLISFHSKGWPAGVPAPLPPGCSAGGQHGFPPRIFQGSLWTKPLLMPSSATLF